MLNYENLIGLPYVDGDQDCYGLLRQYYAQVYGLRLRNYARPIEFADYLNLIADNFTREGFQICETSLDQLEVGDGLLFCLNRHKYVNHVGAFVGNGWMLHHLYNQPSQKDALTTSWRRRVVSVVRHPDISEQNKLLPTQVNFLDLLPPHVKARYATTS